MATAKAKAKAVVGGPQRHKYGAVRVEVDGIKFDSKAEARHYGVLRSRLAAGEIADLQVKPVFVLAPRALLRGRTRPALRYIADFAYTHGDRRVIVDVKGLETPAFRIKEHLMKVVHNMDIEVVKK